MLDFFEEFCWDWFYLRTSRRFLNNGHIRETKEFHDHPKPYAYDAVIRSLSRNAHLVVGQYVFYRQFIQKVIHRGLIFLVAPTAPSTIATKLYAERPPFTVRTVHALQQQHSTYVLLLAHRCWRSSDLPIQRSHAYSARVFTLYTNIWRIQCEYSYS